MKKFNRKNYLYLIYYLALFAIVASKMVQTVYVGSLNIYQNNQLKTLKQQRLVLNEEHQLLATRLATATSLHQLLSSGTLDGYVPIKNPIVISDKALVALK